MAQTAREELGGLGREVRDQAATGVTKARRRTARGLESAASVVDETPGRKGRRRKPLLLAAVAGLAGWAAVKLFRSNGPQAAEADDATDDAAAEAEETARTAKAQDRAAQVQERVDEATERATDKVGAQANARRGSNATH